MRLIGFSSKRSFADYFVILLMSRWRAILPSKYFSIDAGIISKYSLSDAPLVETRKRTFPDCSENVLYISLIYLLHTCCMCVAYDVISNTFCNFPQLL